VIYKKIINAIVSVPVLLVIAWALLLCSAVLAHYCDYVESFQPASIHGLIAVFSCLFTISVLALVMAAISIFIATYAVVFPIFFGDGLLCRSVDSGDFLQNRDGTVFRRFEKKEVLWTWNPILRGRKLLEG
jgi:hypothetical protein